MGKHKRTVTRIPPIQMAEPMGMVFANTAGGTYAGWCRDIWHGHGDAADMHSVFRCYH